VHWEYLEAALARLGDDRRVRKALARFRVRRAVGLGEGPQDEHPRREARRRRQGLSVCVRGGGDGDASGGGGGSRLYAGGGGERGGRSGRGGGMPKKGL